MAEGEVFDYLGPDGAGKTTTVKQKLALFIAFAHRPALLVLAEPARGLHPLDREGRLARVVATGELERTRAYRVEIELTEATAAAAVAGVLGLERVRVEGTRVRVFHRRSFEQLLVALARHRVTSFVSAEPPLEELLEAV